MKKTILSSFALIALVASASATTVIVGGSPAEPRFELAGGGTPVPDGSLIRIGTFGNPDDLGTFTEFGAANSSAEIATIFGAFPGQAVGQVQDNTAAADAFNGARIYMWVYNAATSDAATQQGIFTATGANYSFPANAGGVGDSVTIAPSSINGSIGGWGIPGVDGGPHQLTVIPEASALPLGAFGMLFLLARRRRRA